MTNPPIGKNGEGKIEEIALQENRLSLKISGKYYKFWAQGEEQDEKDNFLADLVGNFKAGDYVQFTYTEKANPNGGSAYKNVRTMKKATPTTANSTPNGTDTSKSILRQVALKVSAEHFKTPGVHEAYQKSGIFEDGKVTSRDVIIADAAFFEHWLNRSFENQNWPQEEE